MGRASAFFRLYDAGPEGTRAWLWGSPPVRVRGFDAEYVVDEHRGLYELREGRLYPEESLPVFHEEDGWSVQNTGPNGLAYVPMSTSPLAPVEPALTLMAKQLVQEQEREWRLKASRHPCQTTFVDYALSLDVTLDQILLILDGTHPALKTGVYGTHYNATQYAGGHRLDAPENRGYCVFEAHGHECAGVLDWLGPDYVLPENIRLHRLEPRKRERVVTVKSFDWMVREKCLPRRPVAPHTRCPVSGIRYSVGKVCSYCPTDARLLLEGACGLCEERLPQAEWSTHLSSHLPNAGPLDPVTVTECFLPIPS